MIQLSQIRRVLVEALLALAPLATSGCESSHACTLIGCLGLRIDFAGNFAPNQTYDVVVSRLAPQPELVVAQCTLTGAGGGSPQQLQCTSSRSVAASGSFLAINDNEDLKTLKISISQGGALVGEQTYTPAYTRREINGEGCGWCNSATVEVAFPL